MEKVNVECPFCHTPLSVKGTFRDLICIRVILCSACEKTFNFDFFRDLDSRGLEVSDVD